MVTEIIIEICKYVGVMLVFLGIKWVLKPHFLKRYFMKFPNVDVNPEATLFYGDYGGNYGSGSEELSEMDINIKQIKLRPDADIRVFFEYRDPWVHLCSPQAVKDFKKLCPHKIDRYDFEKRMFGKMYSHSFDNLKYSSEWKRRQQLFFKHGCLKHPQQLIPMIVNLLEEQINKWSIHKSLDFVEEFGNLTCQIICIALFGKDFIEKIDPCRIKNKDGTYTTMSFTKAVRYIPDECDKSYASILASIFPILNERNLIDPFKTDYCNIKEIYKVLLNYLNKNNQNKITDIELLKFAEQDLKEIDEFSFMNDIFHLLDSGSGTVVFSISSCLYRLKQNLRVMEKLLAELKICGIDNLIKKRDIFTSEDSQSLIQKCEYLDYVVKESLRLDPPSLGSSAYKSLEDIVICDVPLDKGTKIYINAVACHLNPNQWHDPLMFLPERFDPNSVYYTTPGKEELRDSNSYIPFSVGPRSCPAVSFATTQIKTIVAYFLCRVEYDIDEDILQDEDFHIGLEAETNLLGCITRK